MLSYNHFQENKLKYVILFIFLILLLILIRCYCNKNDTFFNKEGFTNKMITDVLLGKKFDNKEVNRISLSDNIKESGRNNLSIIYSTYETQPNPKDSLYKQIYIFLRSNVVNNNKIIGDLFFEIDSMKLSYNNNNDIIINNENVPHLLNPILKDTNAVELTETDIKINKNGDKDIIEQSYNYDKDNGGNLIIGGVDHTTFLMNLLGIKNKNEIYFNDNVKKIYNFFSAGKKDIDFLSKNKTQILNNLRYKNNNRNDLFKIIENVKYKEELEIYYNDINSKTSNVDYQQSQIAIILSSILKQKTNEYNVDGFNKRIYAGYNINEISYSIPFQINVNNKSVKIDNSNKYLFKNNVLKKLQYDNPNNTEIIDRLIEFYDIFIDEIVLFEGTLLETTFYIPYLENNNTYTKVDDIPIETNQNTKNNKMPVKLNIININDNILTSNLKKNYYNLGQGNELNEKINDFKNKIEYILGPGFFLNIPLKIIRMNHPKDDDTHIIFGDILNTGNIINNENNILSNYVKIPRRCCYKTQNYYGDDNNKAVMIIQNTDADPKYSLYQHPIYKTFKVFSDEDNITDKYIYEIEPCAPNISLYKNNIKAYNTLKGECKNIKTSYDENKIKDNSFNKLQIRTKLKTINKNKVNLDNLKKKVNELQHQIDRKDIIKSNYNRVKLQKHNEKKQDQIYEARRRLNNKESVGINITYPQEVIDHLLEIYKNKYILNPEEQDKYNDIYNKLLEFDNKTSNKEFNSFIEQKMKNNEIDIVKLLPDTNSREFKNKYFKKILLQFLTSEDKDMNV